MKTPQYKEKEEVIDEYIRIFIEQHESNVNGRSPVLGKKE